jgi:hypothetical protein
LSATGNDFQGESEPSGEQIRNPKAEGRKKSEGRNPNQNPPKTRAALWVSDFGLRISAFFRSSAFDLRI